MLPSNAVTALTASRLGYPKNQIWAIVSRNTGTNSTFICSHTEVLTVENAAAQAAPPVQP